MTNRAIPGGRSARALSPRETLRCPLCGGPLNLDSLWVSPHWLCPRGHSYSNTDALVAELDSEYRPGVRRPPATPQLPVPAG